MERFDKSRVLYIYTHLLKKLELSKLCRKSYDALKIKKIAYSKLVRNFEKVQVNFFFLF